MGLGRCMYLVHLLRPAGIPYWIIASTIQGHSRAVTSHKVKCDLVKSYIEQSLLLARSLRSDFSVQKFVHDGDKKSNSEACSV